MAYHLLFHPLAQPNIIDYFTGTGANIFSKATESLKTSFSVKTPNIRMLLNELQVRPENFGWNDLFHQERLAPNIKNMLSSNGRCFLKDVKGETSRYINTTSRKRQDNYQQLNA
jgi:hypothetical protein